MAYQFFRYGDPHPCLLVNPEPASPAITIPIVGVPRGGTTMVAAVVDALGVDLGPAKDLAEHTFEDQNMTQADPGLLLSYIAKRNRERKIWGWKYPTAINSLHSVFFALRNPRIIVVFRDIVASIDGEMRFDEQKNITPRRTFADLAKATLNWWDTNMEFISQTAFPVMLVSYERALQAPETFIHELAKFIGRVPSQAQVQDAMTRINPRGGYLRIDEQGAPIRVVEPLPDTVASPILEVPQPPAYP